MVFTGTRDTSDKNYWSPKEFMDEAEFRKKYFKWDYSQFINGYVSGWLKGDAKLWFEAQRMSTASDAVLKREEGWPLFKDIFIEYFETVMGLY